LRIEKSRKAGISGADRVSDFSSDDGTGFFVSERDTVGFESSWRDLAKGVGERKSGEGRRGEEERGW
jgi:hypothetical protein